MLKSVLDASRRCCTQRASSCGGGGRRGSPGRDIRHQPCPTLVDVWGALAPSVPGCHSRARFLTLARHAHPTTQKETTGSPSTRKETTGSSLTEHGNTKMRIQRETRTSMVNPSLVTARRRHFSRLSFPTPFAHFTAPRSIS